MIVFAVSLTFKVNLKCCLLVKELCCFIADFISIILSVRLAACLFVCITVSFFFVSLFVCLYDLQFPSFSIASLLWPVCHSFKFYGRDGCGYEER